MSKPTLCVIVPVYKAAATLDRCVASVLAQQVAGGLHCILVDDGSPDESGGLCDAWAARDPRVTPRPLRRRVLCSGTTPLTSWTLQR